jgi:hypothetical protein
VEGSMQLQGTKFLLLFTDMLKRFSEDSYEWSIVCETVVLPGEYP